MSEIGPVSIGFDVIEEMGRLAVSNQVATDVDYQNEQQEESSKLLEGFLRGIKNQDAIDKIEDSISKIDSRLLSFDPKSTSPKKLKLEQKKQNLAIKLEGLIQNANSAIKRNKKKIEVLQRRVRIHDQVASMGIGLLDGYSKDGSASVAKSSLDHTRALGAQTRLLLHGEDDSDDEGKKIVNKNTNPKTDQGHANNEVNNSGPEKEVLQDKVLSKLPRKGRENPKIPA